MRERAQHMRKELDGFTTGLLSPLLSYILCFLEQPPLLRWQKRPLASSYTVEKRFQVPAQRTPSTGHRTIER